MCTPLEHEKVTHLRPVVAGDLAEGLVAVHDGEVDDLCVGQQEAAVCWNKRWS